MPVCVALSLSLTTEPCHRHSPRNTGLPGSRVCSSPPPLPQCAPQTAVPGSSYQWHLQSCVVERGPQDPVQDKRLGGFPKTPVSKGVYHRVWAEDSKYCRSLLEPSSILHIITTACVLSAFSRKFLRSSRAWYRDRQHGFKSWC